MFCTRWQKNLVAEPQIPSPCTYFLMFYLQDLRSYQRSVKPKAVQRKDLLAQAYQDIQTEAGNPLWICYLWNGTTSEPTAPQNRCSTGIHAPELLHCLFYKKDALTCPFHSYRQPLRHCSCFSPFSSFLCHAGEKHCVDCPYLCAGYAGVMKSLLTLPASTPAPGCTGTSWRVGEGSLVCLSAKNAEESLPSRGGQGASSNRLCSDATLGTHRPAPLMQVQGWLSSCQTDLVLCC